MEQTFTWIENKTNLPTKLDDVSLLDDRSYPLGLGEKFLGQWVTRTLCELGVIAPKRSQFELQQLRVGRGCLPLIREAQDYYIAKAVELYTSK